MESHNQTIFETILSPWQRLVDLLNTLDSGAAAAAAPVRRILLLRDRMGQGPQSGRLYPALQEWGIPYPAFNAALSAWTECLGGALTMVGLATRFVSVAMVINMIVAIVSVKLKNVSGLDDFVELDEPLYALSLVWLGFAGAGAVSLDQLIALALGLDRKSATTKTGAGVVASSG